MGVLWCQHTHVLAFCFLYLVAILSNIGVLVRQILTARKGQRPSSWLDFAEVRDVMLGWDGYKIMCVGAAVPLLELRSNLIVPAVAVDLL